jgi:hypothetical protein
LIVLDCEESFMRQKLPDNEVTTKRINTYRETTLPFISHFDDLEKVTVVMIISITAKYKFWM